MTDPTYTLQKAAMLSASELFNKADLLIFYPDIDVLMLSRSADFPLLVSKRTVFGNTPSTPPPQNSANDALISSACIPYAYRVLHIEFQYSLCSMYILVSIYSIRCQSMQGSSAFSPCRATVPEKEERPSSPTTTTPTKEGIGRGPQAHSLPGPST
jgi:hypothetical protein